MSLLGEWTGREVRCLRLARRMSVREFARHLGVSDRMISKWEAGGAGLRPRQFNQANLDESLRRCTAEERQLFEESLKGFKATATLAVTRWFLLVDLPAGDPTGAFAIRAAVHAVLADHCESAAAPDDTEQRPDRLWGSCGGSAAVRRPSSSRSDCGS